MRVSKESLKFLTLTGRDVEPCDDLDAVDPNELNKHFRIFVKRIRRSYERFEYFAVREWTKSGLQHVHIIFKGPKIPHEWLSLTWEEIHGAKIVDIRTLWGGRYVGAYIGKYLSKQLDTRFWLSWSWVYRGFSRVWKLIRRYYQHGALNQWHKHLDGQTVFLGAGYFIKPYPNPSVSFFLQSDLGKFI